MAAPSCSHGEHLIGWTSYCGPAKMAGMNSYLLGAVLVVIMFILVGLLFSNAMLQSAIRRQGLLIQGQVDLVNKKIDGQRVDDFVRRKADLIKMSVSEPQLLDVWGEDWPAGIDATGKKKLLIQNEIMSNLEILFENDLISETFARQSVKETFDGANGHRYWTYAGSRRLASAETDRARKFHTICAEVLGEPAVHGNGHAAPRE